MSKNKKLSKSDVLKMKKERDEEMRRKSELSGMDGSATVPLSEWKKLPPKQQAAYLVDSPSHFVTEEWRKDLEEIFEFFE